jgi:hypothetical protein
MVYLALLSLYVCDFVISSAEFHFPQFAVVGSVYEGGIYFRKEIRHTWNELQYRSFCFNVQILLAICYANCFLSE